MGGVFLFLEGRKYFKKVKFILKKPLTISRVRDIINYKIKTREAIK